MLHSLSTSTEPEYRLIAPEQLREGGGDLLSCSKKERRADMYSLIILEILVMTEPQSFTSNYGSKPGIITFQSSLNPNHGHVLCFLF